MPLNPNELLYYLNPSVTPGVPVTGKKALQQAFTPQNTIPTLRPSDPSFVEGLALDQYMGGINGGIEDMQLHIGDIPHLGEIAADTQSWYGNIIRGAARTAVPAATKWLQGWAMLGAMPIVAAQDLFEDESTGDTNFLDEVTHNPVAEGLQMAEDYFKREVAPVFKRDDWQDMNVWQKLATDPTSWGADELADGVAFALSALLGGGALGKGLKLGSKIANSAGKALKTEGNIAKGLSALTESEQAMPTLSKLGNLVSKSGAAIDNAVGWGLMTGQEALFETKEYIDTATQGYMNELGLDEQSARVKAAEEAPNIFAANIAILGLSNAWEMSILNRMMGAGAKGTGKLVAKGAGVAEEYSTKLGRWMNTSLAGFRTKEALKGFAVEGLWEENMQGAIKDVQQNYGLSGKDYNALDFAGSSLAQGFANIFNPKKHEEILLGALLGGSMSQIQAGKEFRNERERTKQVLDNINGATDNLMDLNNLFETEDIVDSDGKVTGKQLKIGEDGRPVINPSKVADLQANMEEVQALTAATNSQLEKGNVDAATLYADATVDKWILSHLEAGLEPMLKEKVKALGKITPEALQKFGLATEAYVGGKKLTTADNLRHVQQRVDYLSNLYNTLYDSINSKSRVRNARVKEATRIGGIIQSLKDIRATTNTSLAEIESRISGNNPLFNKLVADYDALETLEKLNLTTPDIEEKQANADRISKRKSTIEGSLATMREADPSLPKDNSFSGLEGPEMLQYKEAKKKQLMLDDNIMNLSKAFDEIANNKTGDSALFKYISKNIAQKDSEVEAVADEAVKRDTPVAGLFSFNPDGTATANGKFFVVENQGDNRKTLDVYVPVQDPTTGQYVLRPIDKVRVKGKSKFDIALQDAPVNATVMTREELLQKNTEIIKQNRGFDFIQALFKRRSKIKQELSNNSEAWSALVSLEAKINAYKKQLLTAIQTLSGEELSRTIDSIQETIKELESEQSFVEDYIRELERDLAGIQSEIDKYYELQILPDGTRQNVYKTAEAALEAEPLLQMGTSLQQELNELEQIKSSYKTLIENLKELVSKLIDKLREIAGRPKTDKRTKEGSRANLMNILESGLTQREKQGLEKEMAATEKLLSEIEAKIQDINNTLNNLPRILQDYNEVIAAYDIASDVEAYSSGGGFIFEEPVNTEAPINLRRKNTLASSAGKHAEYVIENGKIRTVQTEDGAVLNGEPDILDRYLPNGVISQIRNASLRFYNFMSTFRLKPGTDSTVYFKVELGSASSKPENYEYDSQLNLVLYQDGQMLTDETGQPLVVPMHLPSYVDNILLDPSMDPVMVAEAWAGFRREIAEQLLKGQDVFVKVTGKSPGMLNYKARKDNRRIMSSVFGALVGMPGSDLSIIKDDSSPEAKANNKEIRRLRRQLIRSKTGIALTNAKGESFVVINGKTYTVANGGGIYVLHQMGDGIEYPVKLNTRYSNKSDASYLLGLLTLARQGKKEVKFKDANRTIPIFTRGKKEGLIDSIVRWGKNENPDTQLYIEGGINSVTDDSVLVFGDRKMTLRELDEDTNKQIFSSWFESNKIRNISKNFFDKAMKDTEDSAKLGYFETYGLDTSTGEVLWNRFDSYLDYLFNEFYNDGAYRVPMVGTDVVSRNSGAPQILQSYLTYEPVFTTEPPTGGNNVPDEVKEYPLWKVKQREKKQAAQTKAGIVNLESVWTSTSTSKASVNQTNSQTPLDLAKIWAEPTIEEKPVVEPLKPAITTVFASAPGSSPETKALDALTAESLNKPVDLPSTSEAQKKEQQCLPPWNED